MVFNAASGELFVMRNVAHLVPPRLSLSNLLTFPWIEGAVAKGDLRLHGRFFDIRSGILERLGDDGTFRPIPE